MLIVIAGSNNACTSAWLTVLPMALLAAVAVWAAALWLTFVPIPRQAGCLPSVLGFLIILSAQSETLGAWWKRLFIEHCETISLVSPGGWIARAYLAMLSGDTTLLVTLLALTGLAAASLAPALRRWDHSYDPDGVALWYSFYEPPDEWKSVVNVQLESLPLPPCTAEVSEAIAPGEILKPAWASNSVGWVERCLLHRLTTRERIILEFACLKPPDWTNQIKWGAVLVALGIGICWLGRPPGGIHIDGAGLITGGIAILIGCGLGLPLTSPFERAFHPVTTYGISIPFMAVFPVTPHELMKIALKAGVIRALCFYACNYAGRRGTGAHIGLQRLDGRHVGSLLRCIIGVGHSMVANVGAF